MTQIHDIPKKCDKCSKPAVAFVLINKLFGGVLYFVCEEHRIKANKELFFQRYVREHYDEM
jgi:hypothetical protein